MNSIIFQAAKLSDREQISSELSWAATLIQNGASPGRIYGISGGVFSALAFALAYSARLQPQTWGPAVSAISDFIEFFKKTKSSSIQRMNLDPRFGFYNLNPVRNWVSSRLTFYTQRLYANDNQAHSVDDIYISDLPISLYLCAMNQDGTFILFGHPNDGLQFQYFTVQVGPPQDAPLIDAFIASLSTLLSVTPALVNGNWYRDCRPAIVDAGAIIADLEVADPRPILRRRPYAPLLTWKQNWITSSFIMHSQNERNQTLLAAYYLDLLARQQTLTSAYRKLTESTLSKNNLKSDLVDISLPGEDPIVRHVDLPYIGSTEAATNMRQSVENKDALMIRFRQLLNGQLDNFPFHQPTNVIYGAGGFSGILAGLVTTRVVDAGFERSGGQIVQIYGVSAGVLNGFFHAVQLAVARHPDIYKPAALEAIADLENFVAHLTPRQVVSFNWNPTRFWQGWTNLRPLEAFLLERLSVYTGSRFPQQITFEDIALPMTVVAARRDGYTDFLGMAQPDRQITFNNHIWQVRSAPVVQAMIAGWSMNTYVIPSRLGDQTYTDGGGTFYDPGLFVAMLDPQLTNLLNIHLDEPDGHSYNLPPRPNLVRILFDTHNYVFPEERRRMRLLTDLLYQHYRLRIQYEQMLNQLPNEQACLFDPVPPDFRRTWTIPQNHYTN